METFKIYSLNTVFILSGCGWGIHSGMHVAVCLKTYVKILVFMSVPCVRTSEQCCFGERMCGQFCDACREIWQHT